MILNIDPRYTIQSKIASGGMATVYKASDTTLGREVAIKVIHPHLLNNMHAIRRFENEAKVVASLSHENVVKLFDYGKSDDCHYLIMELINGDTLQQVLEKTSTIPNLVLINIFHQIMSGLNAAHGNGVYHRDIKPSNIMIDNSGCVKLMDFGIAHFVNEESLTLTGVLVGSPNYISPEQAGGKTTSDRSDIFSAGTVIYECATGVRPFTKDNVHATLLSICEDMPQPLYALNMKVIPDLAYFVSKCMNKDLQKRPDAKESLSYIDELMEKEQWVSDKNRISSFLKNPDQYRTTEEQELWEHYRNAALSSYRRSSITALRAFSLAQVFKPLTPEDERVITKIKNKAFIKKVTLAALVALLVLSFTGSGVFFVLRQVARRAMIVETHKTGSPGTYESRNIPLSAAEPAATPAVLPETANINNKNHDIHSPKKISAVVLNPRLVVKKTKPSNTLPVASVQEQISAPGYLYVKTNPPWSQVFIDGILVGNSPLLRPLSAGRHRIAVRKEGCEEFMDSLDIPAADTLVRIIPLPRKKT